LYVVHVLHSLLVPQTLPLNSLFIEERLDAYAPRFGTEMSAQRISTRKATTAAPLATLLELSLTDEFLLP
jgi:hypothetical protein